ncbi:MAG: hypothetical protein M3160_10965, partial [Candidatus Eremiobacteraeota bacterium]|nr:hypothetical protein [Candidatus Eremiobacteraeota bacterium]
MARTSRSAALAGLGHVTTTLLLGALLWTIGASLAARYAHYVSLVSAIALLCFGLWIAYGGWKELKDRGHAQAHSPFEHAHLHEHEASMQHVHWHEHDELDWH